ncbi:unnamed protein product [Heterobilharzia americana]|nr:unnamed protein product [Heterobilharzia americana]
MREFSDAEIQSIVRLQACVRGILVRRRFKEALQRFRDIVSEFVSAKTDVIHHSAINVKNPESHVNHSYFVMSSSL